MDVLQQCQCPRFGKKLPSREPFLDRVSGPVSNTEPGRIPQPICRPKVTDTPGEFWNNLQILGIVFACPLSIKKWPVRLTGKFSENPRQDCGRARLFCD